MEIENLKELLENNNLKELKNTLIEMNEYDIAEFLEELDEGEMIKVFRLLPKTIATDTFVNLEDETQKHLINLLSKIPEMILIVYLNILKIQQVL